MLDTKTNKNILLKNEKNHQQIGINKNIINHNDCITQMDNLYKKLEVKEKEYNELNYKHVKLLDRCDKLEEINGKNIVYIKELLLFKDNHKCNDNINIEDIKRDIIKEYNLKYKYMEKKIFEQDKIINNLNKIESPIEDNIIFKQLKERNEVLIHEVKELKNTHNIEINKKKIIEVKLTLESTFLIEKDQIKNNYEKIINDKNIDYDQTYENKFKCPIILFKNVDKSKSYKKAARETVHEIIHYYELFEQMTRDGKTMEDIVKYTIVQKKIKNSDSNRRYVRNKIRRCSYIYKEYGNKYNNKLDALYFSLSKMERIYENNWEDWLTYLNDFITTQKYESDNNINVKNIY
jgi:hypothetical protein